MKGLTHEQRKRLKSEIVEYRKQGHYASECAEHFGVSVDYVHRSCKGIDFPWKCDTETMSNAAKKQAEERLINEQTPIRIIKEKAQWCEYVDGYKNYESYINVRCKTCGKIINISFGTIRAGTSHCTNCERLEKEKKKRQKTKQSWIAKIQRIKAKQIQMKACAKCGSIFVVAGRRTVYCSDECMRAACNAVAKDRRIQRIKRFERDTITIEALYEKANGVCALCGYVCDWNDYKIVNNIFIAGDDYPSVDHIIPLSRGGAHRWENVQLAHRICNTKKRDSIALPGAAV